MQGPNVTIVVVQRERFSSAPASLNSLYSNTTAPFKLVYVDGGSPPEIRDFLVQQSSLRHFTLLRFEHYLTPNEARNIGLARVQTPFVVFVEDNIQFFPGWLDKLLEAAVARDAWLAGPTYLEEHLGTRLVHMAGGEMRIDEIDGQRRFHQDHRFLRVPLDDVQDQLTTGPTELLEFHCMLARTEIFGRLGKLDEGLMSLLDHDDLCMSVTHAGGLILYVADAMICQLIPPPFEAYDLPYFLLRWSEEWNRASVDRFARKWDLDADDPVLAHTLVWAMYHRQLALSRLSWPLGKVAGFLWYHGAASAGKALARKLETAIPAKYLAQRLQALRQSAD
jgi:GT2 family glycosyltransferase